MRRLLYWSMPVQMLKHELVNHRFISGQKWRENGFIAQNQITAIRPNPNANYDKPQRFPP